MGEYIGDTVRYYGPGDVRIEPMEQIPGPGPGEVLLKIEACAVCGTDVKSFTSGNPRIKPPQIIGHELCGSIVALGEGVAGYNVGQRVTMATTIGCGKCVYCKMGRTNLCPDAQAMGFHCDGAMAPYAVIPAAAVRQGHLVEVGDTDAVVAALAEPLSCAVNDLSRAPADMENLVIIGLGPLGFLHAICARGMGVPNIVCVDFPGPRLEAAHEMGFTALPPDALDERYLELSGGIGFDLVVITAPANAVQAQAPKYARKSGYVSYFASLPVGSEMLEMNSRTIHYGELVLYGTSDSTVAHVREAVRLLKANQADFRRLVTHVMPFAEFHKAMDEIKAGNAIKVVLVPEMEDRT